MPSTDQMILGLTGPMGSGKDTVADWLQLNHLMTRYAFADPLKAMTAALIEFTQTKHIKPDPNAYVRDRDLKDTPTPYLANQTPRRIMQMLGTEWGRETVDPDFWVYIMASRIERHMGTRVWHTLKRGIVFTDVRFPNEAAFIHQLGGTVARVERPGHEPSAHASEQPLPADMVVQNDGTIDDLHACLQTIWPRPAFRDPKKT